MYKVVCIDLDGTLLDSKKKISSLNVRVLRALKSQGIDIVIATGRHFEKVYELIEPLGFNCTIIANNGAIALNEDEIFILNPVKKDLEQTVLGKAEEHGLTPYYHIYEKGRKASLIIPEKKSKKIHLNSVCSIDHIYYPSEVDFYYDLLAIVFIDNNYKMTELYSDIVNSGCECEAHIMGGIRKDLVMGEFLEKGSNKARAIQEYVKIKGVEISEIVAIGDENNDIDMLKSVGLGIAMSNASSLLRECADIYSPHCNDDSGVGRELIKLFQLDLGEGM